MHQFTDYWSLVGYIERNNICHSVGCTTCGCMMLRRILRNVGYEALRTMLCQITISDIIRQYTLDWHDILEIIIHDFGNGIAKDTVVYEEYKRIFEIYYKKRRIDHIPPGQARLEIIAEYHQRVETLL